MLVGSVPPNIRSDVYARMERTKQMEQEAHSLFGHIPARIRLKSRKDFMTSLKPSYLVGSNEESAKGYDSPWLTRLCLNKIRKNTERNGATNFNRDTRCACGMAIENFAHVLQRSLLSHHCPLDDLLKFMI